MTKGFDCLTAGSERELGRALDGPPMDQLGPHGPHGPHRSRSWTLDQHGLSTSMDIGPSGSIDRSMISDGVLLTTPTQGGARRERRTLLAGCYSTQLLIQRRDEKVDPEHVQHHRQREQATLHPTREVSPSQDFERALSNSTNVHECPRAQLRLEWVVPKVT